MANGWYCCLINILSHPANTPQRLWMRWPPSLQSLTAKTLSLVLLFVPALLPIKIAQCSRNCLNQGSVCATKMYDWGIQPFPGPALSSPWSCTQQTGSREKRWQGAPLVCPRTGCSFLCPKTKMGRGKWGKPRKKREESRSHGRQEDPAAKQRFETLSQLWHKVFLNKSNIQVTFLPLALLALPMLWNQCAISTVIINTKRTIDKWKESPLLYQAWSMTTRVFQKSTFFSTTTKFKKRAEPTKH